MDRDALLGVESFIVGKGAVELERLSKMIQTSISFGIVRHVGSLKYPGERKYLK
jgi:hypothetical protein